MIVKIVKDKDPIWDTDNFDVILIGTSTHNQLYGGFQSKIKYKYPMVEEANNATNYADPRKMGTRITINGKPTISLMYMCKHPYRNKDVVDYEAFKRVLLTANAEFKGKNVAMTIIGSSKFDGNGDKDKCLEIIKECTQDLRVTIYDYEQKSRIDEIKEQKKYLSSLKYTDEAKYNKLQSVFDSYLEKLYLNG